MNDATEKPPRAWCESRVFFRHLTKVRKCGLPAAGELNGRVFCKDHLKIQTRRLEAAQ